MCGSWGPHKVDGYRVVLALLSLLILATSPFPLHTLPHPSTPFHILPHPSTHTLPYPQVKDCVQGYLDVRDRMRRLYRWVVFMERPEPNTQEQQNAVLKEMEATEAYGGWRIGGEGGVLGYKCAICWSPK